MNSSSQPPSEVSYKDLHGFQNTCKIYLGFKHVTNNPLYSGNPSASTFANNEDHNVIQHLIQIYTVNKVKKISRQKNTILFLNYNSTPLDMYNGLSQVYFIKPKRKNPLVAISIQRIKGLYLKESQGYMFDSQNPVILCR